MTQPTDASPSTSTLQTPDDAFRALKAYFETRDAAKKALGALREGVEIAVSIGGALDAALFQRAGQPCVELRAAKNPDFSFTIRPETIYVLSKQSSDDVGDVGTAILKEILAGHISVRVTGGLMSILSNGYLDILKRGGSQFGAQLAMHGMTGVGKVMAVIKNLRKG